MSDWIDAARAGEAAVATAERTAQGDELNGSTATPSGTRVLSALKDLERDPCRVLVRRPEAAYVGATVAHSGLVSFRSATSHRVISGVGIRLRNQSSPTFVALSPHRPVLIQIE
jgi:predicted aconitase with swiveling domain